MFGDETGAWRERVAAAVERARAEGRDVALASTVGLEQDDAGAWRVSGRGERLAAPLALVLEGKRTEPRLAALDGVCSLLAEGQEPGSLGLARYWALGLHGACLGKPSPWAGRCPELERDGVAFAAELARTQ